MLYYIFLAPQMSFSGRKKWRTINMNINTNFYHFISKKITVKMYTFLYLKMLYTYIFKNTYHTYIYQIQLFSPNNVF